MLFDITKADSVQALPNLVGDWQATGESAKILKKEVPAVKSHGAHTEFTSTSIEYNFTEQQGRLLKGTKVSENRTEKFVCAIGFDNKSIRCTDEDGLQEGQLVSDNEIIMYYHQIDDDISVINQAKLTKKP